LTFDPPSQVSRFWTLSEFALNNPPTPFGVTNQLATDARTLQLYANIDNSDNVKYLRYGISSFPQNGGPPFFFLPPRSLSLFNTQQSHAVNYTQVPFSKTEWKFNPAISSPSRGLPMCGRWSNTSDTMTPSETTPSCTLLSTRGMRHPISPNTQR